MKAEQQQRFLSDSLIFAAELAYVENASGTAHVLQDILRVFRYLNTAEEHAELRQEIDIMRSYLHLQRLHYPDTVEFELPEPSDLPEKYLPGGTLVSRLDEWISQSRSGGQTKCAVKLVLEDADTLRLHFAGDSFEQEYTWKLTS